MFHLLTENGIQAINIPMFFPRQLDSEEYAQMENLPQNEIGRNMVKNLRK